MSLSSLLTINFDTEKFGSAKTLSSDAANTLSMIANTSGTLPAWQEADLAAGINRTNYFTNKTTQHTISLNSSAASIRTTANLVGDMTMFESANNLIIEIAAFQSHTDNVSGVVEVSNTYFPSLSSAQNLGQMNMMTLAKSSTPATDTTPILGSFTSLFIQDELTANSNQMLRFSNEYHNSITETTGGDAEGGFYTTYSSNLTSTQINTILNYVESTKDLLYTRRTSDWDFYNRSQQLTKDVAYMQQFNAMGGTMTSLVNNVIGTERLKNNLS